jgi:hypothetical protein
MASVKKLMPQFKCALAIVFSGQKTNVSVVGVSAFVRALSTLMTIVVCLTSRLFKRQASSLHSGLHRAVMPRIEVRSVKVVVALRGDKTETGKNCRQGSVGRLIDSCC